MPQKGQLGLGDTINRNNPTIVEGLRSKKVVGGSAGKSHSAVVTATGESFTFGLNSAGQLGTGSVKKVKGGEDMSLVPQKVGGWVVWRQCSMRLGWGWAMAAVPAKQ
jgi:alpha-tubulin suppressor-like RCC1 family protein